MNEAKIGFELRKIRVPIEDILPVRQIKNPSKHISRFRAIVTSIEEVGMIEPLMVHPQKGNAKKYLLLDGHLRLIALKELGHTEADCVIASDDECFTYNARISRLAPIQEHKMIKRAVENGVSAERIAASLNIPVKDVSAMVTLLDGIHEEAADLLKDKPMSPKGIRLLKKVVSVRQIEIAELMVSTNNFTVGYADALVLGTPKDQLVNPEQPKQVEGMSAEQIGKMEQEMETLERDLKEIEDSYGDDVLNLTLAQGYIKKILDNGKVVRYLNTHHPEICAEFEKIAAMEAI